MRNFDWLEPASLAEASRLIVGHGEGAKAMAAGTSLILLMRQRLFAPSHLVWLGRVPDLDFLRYDPKEGLRIGAMTRIATLESDPEVRREYPMIHEMARRVANPQIRNVATVGGNLAHADPQSDPPTCFLALGGSVKTYREGRERTIPLEEFFVDFYETVLEPGEILTEVRVPPPPKKAGMVYTRFTATPAEDRPLLGIGVVLTLSGKGACQDVRIAIGASTPVPVRARKAEEFLKGKKPSDEVLTEAGRLASEEVPRVIDDFRGSAGYRREIIGVILKRTGLEACRRVLTG